MPKKLIAESLKLLPKNAPKGQKKLLEQLGGYVPSVDVQHFNVDLFMEMANSHWQLAKSRKEEKPELSIYCPVSRSRNLRKTVIDVVSDDKAFLLDSVVAEINKHKLLINFLIHPIFYVKYNKDGRLEDVSKKPKKGYRRQSHIHIHIKDVVSDDVLEELEKGLHVALSDVYITNRDWRKMLHRLEDARRELAQARTKREPKEIEQYCAFLDYLHDNNFTLLGYREYEFIEDKDGLKSKTIKGESLGLLSDEVKPAYISENAEGLPRNLQELRRKLPPVSVSKTNRLATVHRRVPMDAIAIKLYDVEGNVKGEKLFLGLFTSVTYSRSVGDVPYLREKVDDVMALSEFVPNSHDRKTLRHILEKYPRDEVFQIPKEELLEICLDILRLQERQRVAVFIRRDPFGRYISCLVYIPRDRFGSGLRRRIGEILERELNGTLSNFYTSLDDSVFARVMFMINVDQKAPPEFDQDEIEALLQEEAQTWPERLGDALEKKVKDEEEVTKLTLKYGDAFPISYTARYKAKHSVFDLYKIEEALESGTLQLDLYTQSDDNGGQLRLKVYNPGSPLVLSDVMPILAHLGLRAISELPFEIKPEGVEQSVWIHDFMLEIADKDGLPDIKEVKSKFEKAFTKIWYGEMDSDALNKLILSAAMDWDETIILRMYVRYLKQIQFPFGRLFVEKTLTENAKISGLIVDLFKALHNPENSKAKAADESCAYEAAIETELEKVASLDQDRILRTIGNLVLATLRTNYFQIDEGGERKTYLSVKLDCSQIENLPMPRPYRETYVYSRRMEGVHLRGDKIARGGIRWSDRHEDYRTEVLGLMKAQMVKNSVIVPMGAKGGFVVKSDVQGRDEFLKEGVECYKILIRGLLDIVDNRKGKKIIPPKNVVRRDGDDPYLVVAADKGTATFSDIANGLSQEYDFWLDDAFASGGSAGYDHKEMGITARGAWESVKLHFRQLNHDTQRQDFDVIGVGDMSGDVFGNGMLLSKHIKLVGAFNHLHIFVDPDPDPKESFKERKRLFNKVLGWGEYDTSKLSKGGRVYSRSDKTLTLTPEIKKRFEIEKDKVSPLELLNIMLKARTDLLWFGGIGTYIKGAHEADSEVGDKANDPIRVDGHEVRAKVIGEGANLALTQRGRIEYAEKGGRLNTDFVDNSGGVDSSDHEVNIKILMTDVMAQKAHDMDLEARNALLEKMTEEVADHVLRNNYQQAQAISLVELQAPARLKSHEELIQELERHNGLSRKGEYLPEQDEITERLRLGKGLTRPEICVLVSYAKIKFTQDLLACDLPDQPEMQNWLYNYFPEPLQKNYKTEIKRHRLAREIIATSMASSMVNRMGPAFVLEQRNKTGASNAEIARAYLLVRDIFDLRSLWDSLEALDNQVPAEVQLRAMRDVAQLVEHAVTWFLTNSGGVLDIGQDMKDYGENIRKLRKNMKSLMTTGLKESTKQRADANVRNGLPEALAYQVALLPVLSSACDIIRIALEWKTDLMDTARTYFDLGEELHFDWLRQKAKFIKSDDHWYNEATEAVIDNLYACQAGLTIYILESVKGKKKKDDQAIVEQWLHDRGPLITKDAVFFEEIRKAGTIDLPMLIIAEQNLRNLYGG